MNKTRVIIGALAAIILTSGFFFACNKKKPVKEIDIVNDITPAHTWDQDHYVTLDTLAKIPDGQKMAFIKEHWPTLANDVVANVRGYLPKNSVVDSVIFLYGSGKASANDKRLEIFKGKFNNQLIAAIYLKGDKKSPYLFFVRCLNGMSDPVDVTLNRVGVLNPDFEFYITAEQGLCHHVDYKTAISLAKHFKLKLYRGKVLTPKNRISYKQAEKMSRRTDHTQVTVLVYTGDYFNLRDMTYTRHK